MFYIGVDPSITSTAVVCLRVENGELVETKWCARFKVKKNFVSALKRPDCTDKISEISSCTGYVAMQVPVAKREDRFPRYYQNAEWISGFIKAVVGDSPKSEVFIGIEDYAMKANGRVYDIGEYGCVLRSKLLELAGRGIREHDPNSLKKFASGYGAADKDGMHDAFMKIVDEKVPDWSWVTEKGSVLTDLVDAYYMAQTIKTEMDLRTGRVLLRNLSEDSISIFNRTTKSYPVNLLDRPFTVGISDAN